MGGDDPLIPGPEAQQVSDAPVALITGGARRIGAAIARQLHAAGMRLVIHYRSSAQPALALMEELNQIRSGSVTTIAADLLQIEALEALAVASTAHWGRLDALINNASSFYPTPVGEIRVDDWEDLLGSNLKAPLFLSQALAAELKQRQGAIVNIVDIHGDRPMKAHTVYSVAKAGLVMLTRSLARELGPEVRVNAVAPGAILWPERELDAATREEILERNFLKRQGSAEEIAAAVEFLLNRATYTTGQVLAVDGGRSVNI
ncbi:MAG: pteridine reductase [Gammaproteobacteria bacterium]|nr:pteridine reductase [Gammaproteobacteria bacterium]